MCARPDTTPGSIGSGESLQYVMPCLSKMQVLRLVRRDSVGIHVACDVHAKKLG
jgi:hypothetical protein